MIFLIFTAWLQPKAHFSLRKRATEIQANSHGFLDIKLYECCQFQTSHLSRCWLIDGCFQGWQNLLLCLKNLSYNLRLLFFFTKAVTFVTYLPLNGTYLLKGDSYHKIFVWKCTAICLFSTYSNRNAQYIGYLLTSFWYCTYNYECSLNILHLDFHDCYWILKLILKKKKNIFVHYNCHGAAELERGTRSKERRDAGDAQTTVFNIPTQGWQETHSWHKEVSRDTARKHVQGEMMEIHRTHLDSMNTINTRETRSREAHGEQNTHRQSMGVTIMLWCQNLLIQFRTTNILF